MSWYEQRDVYIDLMLEYGAGEDGHDGWHQDHHHGQGEPRFRMEVIYFCRDALARQVGEAVRIQKRGTVLNSTEEGGPAA